MIADKPDTFRAWLRQEILQILTRHATYSPLLIWCDLERVWKDLLGAATDGGDFEL